MPSRPSLVIVLVDGLGAEVARRFAGGLGALVEARKGTYAELRCELPSLSRPLYECLFTGLRPVDSGVLDNRHPDPSRNASLFSRAREAGVVTAAAAYGWIGELYGKTPFDPFVDRFQLDVEAPVRHGIYYWEDEYPDNHVLADGEYLRRRFGPGLLLVHSMGVDLAGHRHGPGSREYGASVRRVDRLLGVWVPRWMEEGVQVAVTSDHGMGWDGQHGGDTEEERLVPLWLFGDRFVRSVPEGLRIRQTELCGVFCRVLGIASEGLEVCEALLGEGV